MYCLICNAPAYFFISKKDRFGQEYRYIKCSRCRFLFDQDLVLNKNALEVKTAKVYDQEYFTRIDSGWKLRGDKMAGVINAFLKIFGWVRGKKNMTVLDYGAGNGYVTSLLKSPGQIFYYDKYEKPTYRGDFLVSEKPKEANLVCAVELVEHLADLHEWEHISKLSLNALIFTTEVSNGISDDQLQHWVYVNPDAGHTSVYSFEALAILAKKYGFFYVFFPYKFSHIFIKNKFLSRYAVVALEYRVYRILRKLHEIIF